MNLILLHQDELERKNSTVTLTGRRLEHLRKILKSKAGDTVKLGVVNGKMGTGIILAIDQHSAKLEVDCTIDPPAPLDVRLIIALPRPPMIKRILFTAAAMGAKQIYFIGSSRVEKSFWSSSALEKSAIEEQLILGLEQGVDTILPQVHLKKRFKPFVEDELSSISKHTKKYLAHPSPKTAAAMIVSPATIVIGPEGGFIDYEVECFQALGFETISLGERILRVETAATVLLGKLSG